MLETLIIGGGIHGTALSLSLTRRGGLPKDSIRVLDPFPAPLMRWDGLTRNVGMTYLRSPIVHSLHWDQGSMGLFARIHEGDPRISFIPPYGRPSLALFNAHSQHLIAKHGLGEMRIQGRALNLKRIASGWQVETDQGQLAARRVVLAIGLSEVPHWPDWALALKAGGARVHHIFDHGFDREQLAPWMQAVVVGGGITASQTALALARTQQGTVALVRRHGERVHDFDVDIGWMNAIQLRGFWATPELETRAQMIRAARHRGSVPSEVARGLREATQAGSLSVVSTSITDASVAEGISALKLSDGDNQRADLIILGTGFEAQRMGGPLIESLVMQEGLPLVANAAVLTEGLRWADGLYASGPLAELTLGPSARNILGARMAGERLSDSLR